MLYIATSNNGIMADEEGNQPAPPAEGEEVGDAETLKEFDSNDMEKPGSAKGSAKGSRPPSQAGSRPASAKSGADKTSRPASQAGNKPPSRPGSAAAQGSRPASAKSGGNQGSRPGSQAETKPPSRPASGSRPTSASRPLSAKRPTSATIQERPSSAAGKEGGSRPASGQNGDQPDKPPSQAGSRTGSRPASAKQDEVGNTSRPDSQARSRPESAKSGGQISRPESQTQDAPVSRPMSAKSGASEDRNASAIDKTDSDGDEDVPQENGEDNGALFVARSPSTSRNPVGLGVNSRSSIMNVSLLQLVEPSSYEKLLHMTTLEEIDSEEFSESRSLSTQQWNALVPSGDDGDDFGGGGGGGDDDDDDDDEEEDDDDGNFDGGDESDDSDNETDMVVLDPDHPLMKRFQAALNAHLNKQNEKISLELRDLEESLHVKRKEREDLGVELYGVQQELARYQMLLENKHDEVSSLKKERQKEEQELSDVRSLYKDSQFIVNKEQKKGSELQSEVENLALRLFYMDNAKDDVRSDIAVMRRAAEKVESEVSKAEMEKQKQDLYVDRLVEKVDKLKEEIAMYEAQISAQSEETKAAKESLMEAYMEIETINLEKKDLYQKWSSSLIGMRRRDEAHSAMQEALDQQEQHILSLATEIEGFKKSIQKEQEQNEKLTLIFSKTEKEIELAKKHLTQVHAKHDALKAEYTTYTRMLHETEQALARATADRTLKQSEQDSLMKRIEQEYLAKNKLEDEIVEKMQSQLTMDKASQYSRKLTNKTRERTKNLEHEMADVENQIAMATLDTVNVRTRVQRLKKILGELDNEIQEQNNVINKSEQEIVKRNATIERKQNQVDIMNKKLNLMIANAGGVELGPLEIQINSLQKSIDLQNQEVMELQQLWLRQQSELVRLSQSRENEQLELVACKRQLTILSQKKIRTENDIDHQNREMCDIDRNVRNMRNDILKLNTLLHKEKNMGDDLEKGNALMENAFIGGLKDAELQSIELQARLDGIKEEKERLLNSLVEAERQIMLWEKKTQLARETRAAVDSEVGQGEMRAMRAEIHRMQVRHSQLMKQQEKMIQDMEKAVSRRDTILTQGEAQAKMKKKVLTKGTFERQMGEIRKKIKQTINEANACDNEIKELREHQQVLSEKLEEKQINCQQLQGVSDSLDGDVDRTMEVKQKNLTELLARQQKMKYYQQVKDGKYTMICRTPSSLDVENKKQEERLEALTTIVDRLNEEFPRAQPALRKVTIALRAKAAPQPEEA